MLHKKTITKSPFSTTPQNRRHQNPKTNTNQSPNATKPIQTVQSHHNTKHTRNQPTRTDQNQP